MRLDGDGKDKILLLRRGQRLADFARQYAVLRPTARIVFHAVHIFQRCKGLKAEIGIDNMAVIKGRVIIMNGVRRIAELCKGKGNGLRCGGIDNGHIGVFPHAEVIQIHSRQNLKLRVCRARADTGDGQQPARILRL